MHVCHSYKSGDRLWCTVLTRLNAVAFFFSNGWRGTASIRGRCLFEGSI